MINASNIIDVFLGARFYLFAVSPEKVLVYESMPEEGDGVKRRVASCASAAEADAFIELFRAEYKQYLESILVIKDIPASKDVKPPTPASIQKLLKLKGQS